MGKQVSLMIDSFLLGVIVMGFMTAALFFLKFWRETRDSFFLIFAAAFIIESLNRVVVLFLPRPNEGSPGVYLVRLFAFLLFLLAILRKNFASRP